MVVRSTLVLQLPTTLPPRVLKMLCCLCCRIIWSIRLAPSKCRNSLWCRKIRMPLRPILCLIRLRWKSSIRTFRCIIRTKNMVLAAMALMVLAIITRSRKLLKRQISWQMNRILLFVILVTVASLLSLVMVSVLIFSRARFCRKVRRRGFALVILIW